MGESTEPLGLQCPPPPFPGPGAASARQALCRSFWNGPGDGLCTPPASLMLLRSAPAPPAPRRPVCPSQCPGPLQVCLHRASSSPLRRHGAPGGPMKSCGVLVLFRASPEQPAQAEMQRSLILCGSFRVEGRWPCAGVWPGGSGCFALEGRHCSGVSAQCSVKGPRCACSGPLS